MEGTAVIEGVEHPELRSRLQAADLGALQADCAEWLHRSGVTFGSRPFAVDPVPRVIAGEEWETLRAGIVQRVLALEAFVVDVYGERAIVEAGRIPARVLDGADHFEPALTGMDPPGGWIGVAGLDLLRGPDGRFFVVEDNLRTPSGIAYALAARRAVDGALGWAPPERAELRQVAFDALRATLRAAAPDGVEEPFVVLLTDGPSNTAHWEHHVLAGALNIPLVRIEELELRRRQALRSPASRARAPRRRPLPPHRRGPPAGRLGPPDPGRGAQLGPWRAGTLGLVNAFGSGVADDKVVHAYAEEMVRFYLDEEPLLRSVGTFDLGDESARAEVLERMDELVVKPRGGYGGAGVVVGPRVGEAERERAARAVRADPEAHVAQETVWFSRHPTVVDGRLEPRHVDLRPFAYRDGDEVTVVPGGLTRVAFAEDELVVNSSRGGGAKDTWVLAP